MRAAAVAFLVAAGGCALAAGAGCGPSARMIVMKPAEVDLKGVRNIGVAEFAGTRGADVADRLVEGLVRSGRFEVVDREHLRDLLREQRLAASGLVDEDSAVQAGNLAGVQALVFGRVDRRNEVQRGDRWCDSKGRCHTPYQRQARCEVAATVKVILAETGRVAATKTFSEWNQASTSADDRLPDEIDVDALCDLALDRVGEDFVRALSPHPVKVAVRFKKLGDDASQRGFELAKHGQMDLAAEAFLEASQQAFDDPEDQARALFNLGLAYQYTDRFQKAEEALKAAIRLDPDKDYVAELERCRRNEADRRRLESQMRDAGTEGE
jgi:hypothetical protein